jgi:hypothetical protein
MTMFRTIIESLFCCRFFFLIFGWGYYMSGLGVLVWAGRFWEGRVWEGMEIEIYYLLGQGRAHGIDSWKVGVYRHRAEKRMRMPVKERSAGVGVSCSSPCSKTFGRQFLA